MSVSHNPYTLHTLHNGLQIVIEQMPEVRSAAAGFLARTGARDETPEVAGVSHFLEHMMFKGTAKRHWRDITVDFDAMGSSYNAFTSEDRTVFYGWVPKAVIGRQIELLADMMRSMIPSEEFDIEKKVVLEEIAMSNDNIEHVAFDFLQEKLFAGHPLAWPILGYEESVAALPRDAMWAYFQKHYAPDHMILLVAGNVDPSEIIDYAQQYCGSWKPSGNLEVRVAPAIRAGTDVRQVERFNQQVVILSFPSVSARDQRAETVAAISSILGGDNSRLFWNIVQQGLAPQAGAYQMEYTDCGVLMLYALCQPEKAEAVVDAMRAEADRICTAGVTPDEVQRVRNKRKTSLAVECEVPYHRLTQLMDDLEYHGAPRTVEERMREVEDITVESIGAYFQEFPINSGGHLTSVGPRNWPELAHA
jgi:predicted Zn-dependent peptidase